VAVAAERPRAGRDQVGEAVREIRAYWEQGRTSLRDVPETEYREDTIGNAARGLGWNVTKLRKARQFADPESGYTPQRLDELVRLLRQHRPVFGISHVGTLVTVPWDDADESKRRGELQRRCVEGNWSKAELVAEIKRLFGSRRHGGRKRRVAADRVGAYVQLDAMADSWLRWVQRADPEDEEGVLAGLDEGIQKRVRQLASGMRRLRWALAAVLEAQRSAHPDDV
jgi:hypothetical protein